LSVLPIGTDAGANGIVRFLNALVAYNLDKVLFGRITHQLKAKVIRVRTGTPADATIIASASENDDKGHWVNIRTDLRFIASKPIWVPT
jgi:IS5 family transposase